MFIFVFSMKRFNRVIKCLKYCKFASVNFVIVVFTVCNSKNRKIIKLCSYSICFQGLSAYLELSE